MQPARTDPLIGRILDGRYRIRARIAVGGMSVVYAAVDERLDRDVAVKVMTPSLSADPVFLGRFAREARSAAKLSHINAVAVYDQGADAGSVFLVMELVRGRTLRDLIRERGALSPGEAVSLMEPVLAALAAAHRAGLVHRDVKPENILLSDEGLVKVADFGLARAVETDAAATRTGLMMGTVAYSSPEQFRRGNADARTDVYSAGVVLFELLTGRQPHRGPDAMAVAYRHVHEDVVAPSSLQRGVSPVLDQLLARVTARDPARRPADAAAFLAALHDVRRELRLPVMPVPRRQRTGRAGAPAAPVRPGGPPTARIESVDRPGSGRARTGPRGDGPRPPGPGPSPARPAGVQPAAVQPAAVQPAAVQHTAVQRTAVQHTAVQHTALQHTVIAAPPAVARPTTVQANTVRPNTAQLNPVRSDGAHSSPAAPSARMGPGPPGGHGSRSTVAHPPRRRRRRRWLRTLAGSLVLLLVAAGITLGTWWYVAGRWASIPDVRTFPVTRATTTLEAAGFRVAAPRAGPASRCPAAR